MMVAALVDAIPYPLIVRDTGRRIVLANQAARERFGDDLLGASCAEAMSVVHGGCDDCPAREAIETRQPVEREVVHPTTGEHLLVDVFPMYDPDGHLCGIIETARDVTERHRNLTRIQRLLDQVTAQNERLAGWRSSFELQLRTAREVQQRLVPDRPVCIARMCFDFLYRPSGEVGGDLYDLVGLSPTRVGILMSDSSGHGVGAALIATMVKMVFRSPEVSKDDPVAVLARLNQLLVELSPTGQFATAFYGVYDSDTHELRYAVGGHPAPILVRRGCREVGDLEELQGGGLPLGNLEDITIEQHSAEVRPGDKLLLYTDGVPDGANPYGEVFGLERLEAACADNADARGRQFLQRIVRRVDEFIQDASATDDMALLVAEHVHDENGQRDWLAAHEGV